MMFPKKLPDRGEDGPKIIEELKQADRLDTHFDGSKVLYSMCNSPPPVVRQAHNMFLESNLGDAELYPGTVQLEESAVSMLGDILYAPEGFGGHILSGGSEANITSLWIAREMAGKGRDIVILPRSAHYSFFVACKMLSLRPHVVGLNSQYQMSVSEVKEALQDDAVCAVVGIAGTTELGVVDPINELSHLCMEKRTYLHVDAAYGGFVFPFLKRLGRSGFSDFDFRLPGVSAITIDPHKMGRATMPAGALLVRKSSYFDYITSESFYLSSSTQRSMLGTRCSASVAATYAALRLHGWGGYTQIVNECMEKAEYLCSLLRARHFSIVLDPPVSPVVAVRVRSEREDPKRAEEVVDDARAALREDGWYVSKCRNPPALRFVMMPHVRKQVLTDLADLLQRKGKKFGIS